MRATGGCGGLSSLVRLSGVASILCASLAAGCSGGGGGGGSDPDVSARDLYVVDMDLDGQDGVSLNTPLSIEFSEFVRADTIRPDTIQIRVEPRYGLQSPGDFKVAGNIVTFFPQLPQKTNPADLSDAGFQPNLLYKVTVVGYPKPDRVRSYTGRPLVRTFVGSFRTAASTSLDLFTTSTYKDQPPPKILFTNPPDILPQAPWTTTGGSKGVPTDAEIEMVLNRVPLLPSNVTTSNISLTMIERLGVSQNRPIQGSPILEQSFDSVNLRFVPTFPLADQARYVLRIDTHVTDLTGSWDLADNANRTALRTQAEDPGADPALVSFANSHPEEVDPRVFLIFETRDEPTKDLNAPTTYLKFDGTDVDQNGLDGFNSTLSTASFNSAIPGAVAAVFTAAGGTGQLGAFSPSANTTLSTNSPSAVNGTFNYNQITIPANVTVTLTGTLPAALLSLKDVSVSGVINASGVKGSDTTSSSYTSSSIPSSASGGAGGPGGAAGGNSYGSVSSYNWYAAGGDGGTAPNSGGLGGKGGTPGTPSYTYCPGGGGGGGGHQYAGQNGASGSGPGWANGTGGVGGGAQGPQPTSTATNDGRDFYSLGVGGGGGGAAGNFVAYYGLYNWIAGGGAGGGGGGGLLLKSAGNIAISGTINAIGGAGGSGTASSNYYGSGGGAGAGGSIAVYANVSLTTTSAARMDTSGGTGGTIWYNTTYPGKGGNGGGGFIQLEDADGTGMVTANPTLLPDFAQGKFDPTGQAGDAPSVFTGTWFNLGVIDPMLQPFTVSDITEQNYVGDTIAYELQMAREDPQNFGKADTGSVNALTGASSDLTRASNWQTFRDANNNLIDITSSMNGYHYQFYRVRITFTLKTGQKRTDLLPYCDQLHFRFRY